MKISLQKVIDRVAKTPARLRRPLATKPRNLRSELRKQSTESYWRRRQNPRFRKLRPAHYKPGLKASIDAAQRTTRPIPGIIRSAIIPILMALMVGFILLGAAVTAEFFLDCYVWPNLIPPEPSLSSLDPFPILAVQVLASLLGFYLASVSIVLGTSYHDVSADTRDLVLGSPRTKIYLATVGTAIGGGLTLVLLGSLDVPYGYMTVGVYVLIVVSAGWSFVQLAYGAFRLFDPTALSEEPLIGLYRVFGQLSSDSLRQNESALQIAAQKANRDLLILAELISMTSDRVSIDRGRLAAIVRNLLRGVQFYAQGKHLLSSTSAWFLREPSYPRWVESSESEVSIALRTATSLPAGWEPSVDWVEKRSAELASAAIEACVTANERDSALSITNELARTAYTLARCYRIDEAMTFACVIRDRCWIIKESNPAAVVITAAPPIILAHLLLGWRDAITDWPNEIQRIVEQTKWDSRRTETVPVRGSQRVWETAQRLLDEVKSERNVQGNRATPDWYLKLALSDACLLSLREVANELPKSLDDFLTPDLTSVSPEATATLGLQGLETLAKAQLVTNTLPQVVENLDKLMLGNDREKGDEFELLSQGVKRSRVKVLGRISEAVLELRPERSKSEPDLFGQCLFTLVHYTEDSIAKGHTSEVREVFPKVLRATFALQEYLQHTYQAPTYQVNTTILDPVMDILELSGLALVYAALRNDQSDLPIREAWGNLLESLPQADAASRVLNMLDLVDGYLSRGISPRSIARTEWEMRLSRQVREAGYAQPTSHPFEEQRTWNAPPLIKMLGVSERGGSISLKPRAIFAAEVIGPLSGESEEALKRRRGLRRYYEKRNQYSDYESPVVAEAADGDVVSENTEGQSL